MAFAMRKADHARLNRFGIASVFRFRRNDQEAHADKCQTNNKENDLHDFVCDCRSGTQFVQTMFGRRK